MMMKILLVMVLLAFLCLSAQAKPVAKVKLLNTYQYTMSLAIPLILLYVWGWEGRVGRDFTAV